MAMAKKECSWIDCTADVLVVIGAVNWGLVGLGGWNVVNLLLGRVAWLESLVYVLVGLSGLYMAYRLWGK